ncbi:hypothetical protein CMT42_01380 [Elizabethkingia anophelis]|uniref:hypothetical protein n=1 Tax=Elizabethkingia anophelis TaxID=1117645 RepID=UPI00099A710D|nr:hypothetical protein [Elizabethkingia anophelis]MDV2442451.1 hypothetical protein [Elizabethkingia anophelis]MDV3611044.1 hypothetical protein [Elizabethkingia anophelis]MDV3697796.1 hypothetical protein [Elizabethkingia anophelis]MDV3893305.1 hypothetical protein [Elizabethkingia anophelis]MDV3915638.1 hypothetical protein [Elizabethkingia anophelis]
MNTKSALYLFFVFFAGIFYSQQKTVISQSVKGDLNKDGIPDLATVKATKNNDITTYILEIYFLDKEGNKKLEVNTASAIEASQDGTGGSLENIEIVKGTLHINYSFLRGQSKHIFRYQNNRFELIGFSYGASDGQGHITEVEFNLSTGRYIRKLSNYETGDTESEENKIVKIKPLPNLKNFEPYRSKYFY